MPRRLSHCRAPVAWLFQGQGKLRVHRSRNLCQWRPHTGVPGPASGAPAPGLQSLTPQGPHSGFSFLESTPPPHLSKLSSPFTCHSNLTSQAASPGSPQVPATPITLRPCGRGSESPLCLGGFPMSPEHSACSWTIWRPWAAGPTSESLTLGRFGTQPGHVHFYHVPQKHSCWSGGHISGTKIFTEGITCSGLKQLNKNSNGKRRFSTK